MSVPNGIQKEVIIGKETTWAVAATDTVGKSLRRVTADINLTKSTFESNEKRKDYQVADMRHGTRRVEGSVNGELSCGTYEDILAAHLRAAWVAGVTTGAISVVAAAASGNKYVRSSGSFLTDGFKIGDVVTVSGFTEAANNGRAMVTGVTATDLSVIGLTLTDEVEGDSVTILVAGKKLMIPSSSHTDDSFSIESLYDMGGGDVISELAVGCKFSTCDVAVQPNGMTTINFGVLGKDMDSDDQGEYFQAPAAQTTTGVMAGPQGMILRDGVAIATVTGFNFNSNGSMDTGQVVGAKVTPAVFVGRIRVSGQLQAYFEDNILWSAFKDETELSLILRLDAGSDQTMVIKLPRIKLGGNTKDDPETGGIVQTVPFTALRYVGTGPYEASTIVWQDTTLS